MYSGTSETPRSPPPLGFTFGSDASQFTNEALEKWVAAAASHGTHLLYIELFRLLIVACGMLSHCSSMAVRNSWILAGTGTSCRSHWSRPFQTCSKGDMSGEYAGHRRIGTFSALSIVYRSLRRGAVRCHAETWGDGGRWMAGQQPSGSCHVLNTNQTSVSTRLKAS